MAKTALGLRQAVKTKTITPEAALEKLNKMAKKSGYASDRALGWLKRAKDRFAS